MGRLELTSKKRKKRRDIKNTVLLAVQTAALTGLALTNLPAALYKLGLMKNVKDGPVISRARTQLLKEGLLAINKAGFLSLTPKGSARLSFAIEKQAIAKPRKWDGRWRVLIFDIPEYRKVIRNRIRRTLQAVGFLRLQDSVWIFPHDCEDFTVLLKADFRLGKEVLYMIVDELEGDQWIRKHFSVPT